MPVIPEFLASKKLPKDVDLRKRIMEAEKYVLEDDVLYRKIRDGVTAPFIEFEWHEELMQRMLDGYDHLTPQNLASFH